MSHVATVKIEIKDLDALAGACRELGLELVRDQKTHCYDGGSQAPCEHAIRIPGAGTAASEIGLVKQADGKPGWQLSWQAYGGGRIAQFVGADCAQLKQQYAKQVAIRHARSHGYRVQQSVRADGSIVMQLTK